MSRTPGRAELAVSRQRSGPSQAGQAHALPMLKGAQQIVWPARCHQCSAGRYNPALTRPCSVTRPTRRALSTTGKKVTLRGGHSISCMQACQVRQHSASCTADPPGSPLPTTIQGQKHMHSRACHRQPTHHEVMKAQLVLSLNFDQYTTVALLLFVLVKQRTSMASMALTSEEHVRGLLCMTSSSRVSSTWPHPQQTASRHPRAHGALHLGTPLSRHGCIPAECRLC